MSSLSVENNNSYIVDWKKLIWYYKWNYEIIIVWESKIKVNNKNSIRKSTGPLLNKNEILKSSNSDRANILYNF